MTRQELRLALDDLMCGCGSPDAACATLLAVLDLHPLYEHRQEIEALLPDAGVRMLVLYQLDRLAWIEHGGTVEGGWLTPLGVDVRDALRREQADFDALMDNFCAHGYDLDDPAHDCGVTGDGIQTT